VRKVENADGITLVEQAPAVKEVTSQQTARTMMRLLKEVTRSGTGAAAAQLKHPLGGKTGTTSDYTDAWFLGFSPSVTCGVWVGFDSRQSLGEKETGARAALPIWMTFMKAAIQGKDNERFSGDPETVLKAEAAPPSANPSVISPGSAKSPPAHPASTVGPVAPTPGAKPPAAITNAKPPMAPRPPVTAVPKAAPRIPGQTIPGQSTPPAQPKPTVRPAFPSAQDPAPPKPKPRPATPQP
jgi:penicillin-binding protein 1A